MAEFWHTSTDVIVIGSDAAGLSAAIEARQAGSAVMVFEKMPVVGGNTRISDGGLSAPGNFMQKRLGITDSVRMFYDDIMQAGLQIDENARVMDLAHRPIGHFFAAGEVTGGIHGAGRLGGCALPECIVFGRIAGQQAATMNPKC